MSTPLKRSLAESTSTRKRDHQQSTGNTAMCVPRHVTTIRPGEGAQSIPRDKPASAASNWRRSMNRAKGGCQVYLQVHKLGGWSVRLQEHQRDDEKTKRVWTMRNKCIYAFQSSSEEDWKRSPNVPNCLPNGITRDRRWITSKQDIVEGLNIGVES